MTHRFYPLVALMLAVLLGANTLEAQAPRRYTSAELYQAVRKLNFLGSALYLAAHPDDENTRLIAYLDNELMAHTAYLSLTRGDGGQNLVGPEIRELLGLIRTQELLAARRTDGGDQFFTRANDYGYSKHSDEAFVTWDSLAVLSDVVWIIRNWQPDIIVNRFDHRSPGSTHGHHTASAMLGVTAFDLVGDPQAFPEQLRYVSTWQPRRIFFNTSWWFYGSQEKFDAADKSRMARVDIGSYYPATGLSNAEIAAHSRTQHKSQGFGSTGARGSEMEYLELIKGDMPADPTNLFAGINTTWSRVPGGEPIGKLLAAAADNFDFREPARNVPALLEAYRLIEALPDGYWKRVKAAEIKTVIAGCLGLFVEAIADDFSATPGQTIKVKIEAINRTTYPVTLASVGFAPLQADTTLQVLLDFNQRYTLTRSLSLPTSLPLTNSYWLNEPFDIGMYRVDNQLLRGLPETPPSLRLRYSLLLDGQRLDFETPVAFKSNDPVDGEVYRPFEVTPPAAVNLNEQAFVFADDEPRSIQATVVAGRDNLTGRLQLQTGPGWRVEPAAYDLALARKGDEQIFRFTLFPPANASDSQLTPEVVVDGQTYSRRRVLVQYDHIPTQMVFLPAAARTVRVPLQRVGQRVGYLMGAGDEVPAALRQIGYDVTLLEDRDLTTDHLAQFDAVVLGVRAYNTLDRSPVFQPILLDYVRRGGNLIVQYNTNRGLKLPDGELAPYPLSLGRERVTIEEAEVRFLAPRHPALNQPNRITAADFDGWVQERGLYFAEKWAPEFTAILSSNDPGEPARDGSLVIAPYGEGYYVYTGLAFFRQLPAGVPGAFRLMANLIGLGATGGE